MGENFPLISCKLYSVHFLYMLLTVSFNHKINFKFYLYLPNILTSDLRNQFINRRAVSMDCDCTETYLKHLFQSVLWLLQTNKAKHKIGVNPLLFKTFPLFSNKMCSSTNFFLKMVRKFLLYLLPNHLTEDKPLPAHYLQPSFCTEGVMLYRLVDGFI